MNLLRHWLISAGFWVIGCLYLNVPAFAQDTVHAPAITAPSLQTDMIFYDAERAKLKGDDKEAEQLLLKVVQQKPDAAGAFYELARLNFKQNRPEKAEEYIKKAISIDDSNPWYKSQYAEILVLANRQDEAADIYVQLAKTQKYNREFLLKAAHMYVYKNKPKEAMQALDQLLQKDSTDEEILNDKIDLYLKANDVDGAIKTTQKLITLYPKDGRYYATLAEIYENNKMPEKAETLYKQIEQQFGDEAPVQLSLAEYYKKKNDPVKYELFVKKAITNRSLDADMQISLLASYWQNNFRDTSKRNDLEGIAKEVAMQHPGNANALAAYAQALAVNNKTAASQEYYKKSVAVDGSQYGIWLNLLSGYTDKQNADSLIKYSEKALRLFPNQAMLHYLNGIGKMNKGDYKNAVKSINRAIDMQPEDNKGQLAQMYTLLGDAYNFDKQYPQSDEAYNKALALDPENATVLNNYAYYLSVRGVRLDDAEKMSRKSLEIRKNEPTFMDTYGWILYKQGKYDKALEYIQKAIDANGINADGTVWEHLGDVYYKLNEVDKAVEAWKKAKEKGTDNIEIDKKIKDRKLYES
ncbi:MAG: hypothetical protein BGO70_05290 [Bacteroidetes bacterium 43-93]|nr:tetratricopeptide repeat protein [Bacteroidota bacterium]OJW96815.1 MAG: hypothetical protein BGO70_05290 [Bacteroidetes bacterium 43-93]